ncbi:MAG: pyridoxal phosphate-dependent aminotransferase [Rickettsiales bacterium]|nr:pyridoxal phosphate-dependent aminotransferase [Rickettsiales bacterium]
MYNFEEKKKIPLEVREGNLNKVAFSDSVYINQKCSEMEAEGRNIFKFGFGQSPFYPPQNVRDALNANGNFTSYTHPQGVISLREKIADFHSTQKTNITADNVFVGPGSKMMIFAIMAIFKQATIFIPAPSWVSYEPQARILNQHVKRIKTDRSNRYLLNNELLEKAFSQTPVNDNRQKILILTYPGNPNGISYSSDNLRALARICQRHNVLIIADEISSLLTYTGRHESIIDYYPEGTIVTTGLSKWCAVGGWRLGCCYYSRDLGDSLKSTLLGICLETYSCVASPIQNAAIVAYENLKLDKGYLYKQRRILQYLSEYSYGRFNDHNIVTDKGEGGFCLMLDFSKYKEKLKKHDLTSDSKLCLDLLESKNVMLLPASSFGMRDHDYLARYAFVDFDGAGALGEFTGEFTEEYCNKYFAKIYEGVSRICEYVRNL